MTCPPQTNQNDCNPSPRDSHACLTHYFRPDVVVESLRRSARSTSGFGNAHARLTSLRHQLRKVPVEVLELSPPYVQTELTGARQASDPHAMPIGDYIGQVIQMLENRDHLRGERLLELDHARRWAERDGTYDAIFAAMNPK